MSTLVSALPLTKGKLIVVDDLHDLHNLHDSAQHIRRRGPGPIEG